MYFHLHLHVLPSSFCLAIGQGMALTGVRARESPRTVSLAGCQGIPQQFTHLLECWDWQAGHGAIVHFILKVFGLNNGGKSRWVEESRWDLRCVGVMG